MEAEQIKRPRRTSLEIKKLLNEFKQSGDAKAFCKTHGITEGVFYKWKARYLNKPAAKQNGFITLQPFMPEASLFAEVKGIKIYRAVDAAYLKALLA
jgi:hypothetical protein